MGDYLGKTFVCRAPNNFAIERKTWNYFPNFQTTLIKSKVVGICNSDFSRLFNGTSYRYPITPGHEILGVVEESSCNEKLLTDSLVYVFPLLPCKSCENCKKQDYNLCSHYSYLGSRQDGALSTYFEVPNWNIRPLPYDLPLKLLPMIEPLSVVFHGFAKIKGAGTSLLITGSGFLSYASLCVAKYLNFKNVRILSTSKSNSDIYEGFSFVEEIDSDLDFDCCIDFSGNFNLLNLATTLLLPKSTIVSLANSREDTFLDVEARNQIIRKELRYLGSWNSTFSKQMDDWQEAITFIASRPTFAYPVKEIMLEDLPNYLNSISPNFPRERIHVRF